MQAQRPGDILLIESNAAFATALKTALSVRGHNVTCAATAREAQAQLERFAFDVVLCAHYLPDSDGRAIADAIKTAPDFALTSVALLVDSMSEIEDVTAHAPRGGSVNAPPPRESAPPDDYISRQAPPDEINHRVQSLMRLGRYQEEISNAIGTLMKIAEGVEEQDKRLVGHCNRLSIMAVELGTVVGCDEWQLLTLERAGYLHDIGKTAIPGAVMEKTDRLSPREMEIIQGHCVAGERMCQNVAALKPVLPIIRHHHERADGTGYPDRLRGEQIPILAQIFSIPDIYDALRMWRPYRPPMNQVQAIDLIRQEVARGYWNRLIFDAFVSQVLPGLDERLSNVGALWPMDI